MLNWRDPENIVCAVASAAFYIFLAWCSWQLPSLPPYQINNGTKDYYANKAPEQETAPVTHWQVFGIIITPADALAGFLVIANVGLWIVTWRGIYNQSRETRIIQRAYISVEPAGLHAYEGDDPRIACNVFIVNAGNLPAQRVRWGIERTYSDDPFQSNFDFAKIVVVPKNTSGREGIVLAAKARAKKGSVPTW